MKKLSILSSLIIFSLTAFSQGGTTPDWASKAGSIGIGANSSLGFYNNSNEQNPGLKFSGSHVSGLLGIQYVITSGLVVSGHGGAQSTTNTWEFGNGDMQSSKVAGPVYGLGVAKSLVSFANQQVVLSAITNFLWFNGKQTETLNNVSVVTDNVSQFSFSAGLKTEYHFMNFFGMHTEVGFVFALINRSETSYEDRIVPGTPISTEVSVSGPSFGSDLFGGAGFTVWFN